jgi:hypothetical protein
VSPTGRGGLALLGNAWSTGCAGHASDGGSTDGACATIAAPFRVQLPHLTASSANATAIEQALDAIFAAQSPPLSPGATYAIPTLDCAAPGGYECVFQLQVGGGQPSTVTLPPPSTLAQNLATALTTAGAQGCPGKESSGAVQVANMTVSGNAVQWDDPSQYAAFPAPNLTITGPDARSVVDAFAAGGIDDCDPTRYVFLVCGTQGGAAPQCSYQWMPLTKVGTSQAVPVCTGAGATSPGATLTSAASLTLWQAILRAATDSGFVPQEGTVAQANVVNARYFTWDGSTLTCTIFMGDATPPGDAGAP